MRTGSHCLNSDYVRFMGTVSNADLSSLYKACDIFVIPNRLGRNGDSEGFGIVYLEANAYGKPVVGARHGGVPDAVLDGVNGLLIEPDNPKELKRAVERLLADDEFSHRIVQAGYERVIREFTLPKIALKLEPFL